MKKNTLTGNLVVNTSMIELKGNNMYIVLCVGCCMFYCKDKYQGMKNLQYLLSGRHETYRSTMINNYYSLCIH